MRRALAPLLAAVLVLTLAASTTSAAQAVQRTWRASLGTGAAHGHEVLTAYTNDTGAASLELIAMRANASYAAQVWAGNCSNLKVRLVSWTGIKTDATGAATASRNIGSTIMNKIWAYARPGSLAIRFVAGSSIACANLGFYHATRVYIPSYKINLPVVPGPSGYPYCNVAMYQQVLWQPTEPGVTFIYAHARTGMFLPLLNASKINNGAAMIGKLVYVYTSNSMMYTYKIVQVRRHVKSVQSSIGITTEHLWLQTSEGPNFTYPKLIIVADRIASAPATYAASHPTPHIVHCT
jgi:hypothetical protein